MSQTVLLPVHIIAAVVALACGYVALFATKGAPLHRKAGMLFVYAMMVMSLSAAYIAAVANVTTSVIAGLLTFYFVVTGMLTVRRTPPPSWIQVAGVAVALSVGLLALRAGFDMIARGRPEAVPMLIFGGMALLGATGDVRVMRSGGIAGRLRIKRHLWRMCFAMWVAAASFFWGPPNRVPELIRYPLLFPIPVLAPIAVMFYWQWRMRRKRTVVLATRPDQAIEALI
ncbi:MAG: DUF2306 domain-containing protein [Vicinamibacterales bacterium]